MEKTECVALTRWDFMSELKGSPTMAVEILRGLARRLRQCDASPTDGSAIVQYLDGGLVWVSAAAK
jgi:hypothetical protein